MIEAPSIAFKRRPSSETTLDVFGVDVTFLVENEHTGGRFGVLEYVSKPDMNHLRTGMNTKTRCSTSLKAILRCID